MGRMGASGKSDRKIIDMIYPVGSVYISVSNVSPATLFGGSWEQLKDRFMLGAGDTYTAGATGGSTTHTHGLANAYAKVAVYGDGYVGADCSGVTVTTYSSQRTRTTTSVGTINATGATRLTGNTDGSNHLPPYLVVYIWKRTA